MKTPNGYNEIIKEFGLPYHSNGKINEAWESNNIKRVKPPGQWRLYYQDDGNLTEISGIRLHVKLHDSFRAVLSDIWDEARKQIGGTPQVDEVREWLHKRRLDQYGGAFNFRKIAGSSNYSLHSWGIAIDWDPDHNPRKKPLTHTLPEWWYAIWTAHGWMDGRKWNTPDPMHVQFATGA